MRLASTGAIAADPGRAHRSSSADHPVLPMTVGSSCPSTAATEASAKLAPPRSRRTIAGVAHVGPSDATE